MHITPPKSHINCFARTLGKQADNKNASILTKWGGESDATFMLANSGYILTWNNGKTQVSVHLNPNNNLPTIDESGTYDNFATFAAAFQCFPVQMEDGDWTTNDKESNTNKKEANNNKIKTYYRVGT